MCRHKHKRTTLLLPVVNNPKRKGSFNRRLILGGNDGKRDYILHATKGWRSYRT